jgi:hypothetical protein
MRKSSLFFVGGCLLLAVAIIAPRFVPLSDTAQGLLFGLAIGGILTSLLKSRLPDACDTGTPALRKRYLREILPPILGYIVVLFLSMWLLKRIELPWLRAAVALSPVVPLALAIRAIVHYIRDADEMQRRIELEAVSIATAFVSLLYMAGGFLQLAKVIDIPAGVAMLWVFPLVGLTYGLGKVAVMRRYV